MLRCCWIGSRGRSWSLRSMAWWHWHYAWHTNFLCLLCKHTLLVCVRQTCNKQNKCKKNQQKWMSLSYLFVSNSLNSEAISSPTALYRKRTRIKVHVRFASVSFQFHSFCCLSILICDLEATIKLKILTSFTNRLSLFYYILSGSTDSGVGSGDLAILEDQVRSLECLNQKAAVSVATAITRVFDTCTACRWLPNAPTSFVSFTSYVLFDLCTRLSFSLCRSLSTAYLVML